MTKIQGDEEQNVADASELSPRPAQSRDPLRWHRVGHLVVHSDLTPLCQASSATNAEFIVNALNAHNALVDIAKRVAFMFGNPKTYPENTMGYRLSTDACVALALAGVTTLERETETRTKR